MLDFNRNLIEDLRAHGGKASGGPFAEQELLILTTTGAKTGSRRSTPLVYTVDGDRYVIVASKGGAPTNPDWFNNIRANPNVVIEVGGEAFNAVATVTDETERKRLYAQHADKYASFHDYVKKTTRVIPVLTIERKAAVAA